LKYETL